MEIKNPKPKRKFSDEFKKEAIELASSVGNNKASKELGLSPSLIRTWKSQLKEKSLNPNKKTYEELEQENKRLLKENFYIKEINNVLKKSTAIFSQEIMGNLK